MDSRDQQLTIEHVMHVLRRGALVIVLCFLAVGGAAFVVSKLQRKQYTATTSLLFTNTQLSQQVAGLSTAADTDPTAQQDTNVELVQLGDMARLTAAKLGHGLTAAKVRNSLTVTPQGDTNVVNVAATASSPTLAAAIANTYTSRFVAEQQVSSRQYYSSALALVNQELAALPAKQRLSPAAVALEDRAQSLGILANLQFGNVTVAQAAQVPTGPSSPKVARNTGIGLLLGLMLGVGIAFLLERLGPRLRNPADFEAAYDLPLLGVITESSSLGKQSVSRAAPGSVLALPAKDAEAFQLLRARLRYYNVDRDLRTLLVASAAPGDGKTTIAMHLVGAAAAMGSRCLLVETDLRRPVLAERLQTKRSPGLSDVLVREYSVGDAVQVVEPKFDDARPDRGHSFEVLVAGSVVPPNPGELLESHAMEEFLDYVRMQYDLVVLDTPPLTIVSDAFPLLRCVDGVIVVGRAGTNRRDVAERLRKTLLGAGASLLGVVVNGVRIGRLGAYGSEYEYGYTYASGTPTNGNGSNGNANSAIAGQPGASWGRRKQPAKK